MCYFAILQFWFVGFCPFWVSVAGIAEAELLLELLELLESEARIRCLAVTFVGGAEALILWPQIARIVWWRANYGAGGH
jgi:hypothetical protein